MARRKLLLNLRGGISGTEESMWLRSGPTSAWVTLWDQSPSGELWVLSRLHQGLPAAEDTARSCSSSSSFCPGWNQSLHIPKYDSSNSLSSCLGPSPGISVAEFWAQVRHCWNQSRQLLLQWQDQIGRLPQSALSTLGPSWVTALSQTPKPLEVIVLGYQVSLGFPSGAVVKNPPANAEYVGWIPGPGRSPGEGNGNPLQYSCLGNTMARGAWRATVHGVTKSWTQLSTHVHTHTHTCTHTHTHIYQVSLEPRVSEQRGDRVG